VVRDVRDDRQLLELALVENLQRSDLNPIEEALAFQSLQEEFGLGHEEIAARVGKSRPTISNALRLLNLPAKVQELMRAGRLTAGQARPLLALGKAADQVALAERAVADGLSARQLEAIATKGRGKAAKRKTKPTAADVHTAAAAERLTRRLQTKVEIRRRRTGGGLLQIHFFSEEDLMRLYDRLIAGEDDAT
jgi:ParB family chromosome partitioning protein